jgi:hypothetical protein
LFGVRRDLGTESSSTAAPGEWLDEVARRLYAGWLPPYMQGAQYSSISSEG